MCLEMTPGFDREKYEQGRLEISRQIWQDLTTNMTPQDRLRAARKQSKGL